jgi:hypothetical protein
MNTEQYKAEDLKARLTEASATIEVAHRALSEGKIVSLDGLETHVDITCRGITALPKAEGQALQATMLALIDGLEQLTQALGRDHGETKSALAKLSNRERALAAYAPTGKS